MELIKEEWTQSDYDELVSYLYSIADEKYRDFNKKLIPGGADIIGIRMPELRSMAKKISKGDKDGFLSCKKSGTNEELILNGLVLASRNVSYEELMEDMLSFAGSITNWAVCDTVKFNAAGQYKERLIKDIDIFLFNKNPWVQRYGFKLLMEQYLEEGYIDFVLEKTVTVRSDFYYLQMMQGWLIATAAVEFPQKVMELLEGGRLSAPVQNIAIQKMRESRRISGEDKKKAAQYKRTT